MRQPTFSIPHGGAPCFVMAGRTVSSHRFG